MPSAPSIFPGSRNCLPSRSLSTCATSTQPRKCRPPALPITASAAPAAPLPNSLPPSASLHRPGFPGTTLKEEAMRTVAKRVLVTGGAGFLGSHLCDRLIAHGHDVLCVDTYFTAPTPYIRHMWHDPNFHAMRH